MTLGFWRNVHISSCPNFPPERGWPGAVLALHPCPGHLGPGMLLALLDEASLSVFLLLEGVAAVREGTLLNVPCGQPWASGVLPPA